VDRARQGAQVVGDFFDACVDGLGGHAGILACALGALGCSSEPASPPPGPPSAAPSAAPLPPRLCEPAAARCLDADRAERCNGDGSAWEPLGCSAGQVCIDDGCAPLDTPGGALPRAALLRPTGPGWINAWASIGAMFDEAARAMVAPPDAPFAAAEARRFEAMCRPEAFVRVHGRRYDKKTRRHHLLIGYAVSSRARPATLALGVEGQARVWVGGALVADVDAAERGAALPDERRAAVTLAAGVNPVIVDIAQPGDAPSGLWLRFADEGGGPLRGLAWALPHDKRCGLAALTAARIEPAVVPGGFELAVALELRGLAPSEAEPLDFILGLGEGDGALARGAAAPAALEAGVRMRVTAPFAAAGREAVKLESAGVVLASRPLQHRGELHERVAKLRQTRVPATIPEDSRDSFTHDLSLIARALATGHPDVAWIRRRTGELEQLGAQLAGGADAYATRTGVVHRAYRSELDDQLQPYVVYVPAGAVRGGAPTPLVVAFHGLGQEPALALRTVVGMAPAEDDDRDYATRHLPPIPDLGALIAAPWGYDAAGQRQLGEHDVLAVIERMQRHYHVDDARISLTGYSLGGTVAFVVPLHYPDRFAAAAPLCGYPNLTGWTSIAEVPKQPFEELLIERRYIYNYAENGVHLPLHIVHGGKDGPQRSALMAKRYRELGYRREFDLQDELDHNVWEHGYEGGRMIRWLTAQKRPAQPDRVRLKSADYRYHRAFWLRLVKLADPNGFGDIDAAFDRKRGELTVTTKGVDAFAVDAGALGATPTAVTVDGRDVPRGAAPATELVFVRGGDGWAAGSEPDRRGHKRPGVAGPLDDVLRHRVLVVYGTRDPAQRFANRVVAQHFAGHDTSAAARFRVAADVDVVPEDLVGKSLVLIGNPASNRVTAELAGELPVVFDEGGLSFRGTRYPGADVGVSFIYPHPRDPAEYVVVHAGVGPIGTLASRHLPRLAPDFLVYDERLGGGRAGELLGESRPILAGGFFDDAWR
jgi:poly(3-hydroxybutyrate) depolymerase